MEPLRLLSLKEELSLSILTFFKELRLGHLATSCVPLPPAPQDNALPQG